MNGERNMADPRQIEARVLKSKATALRNRGEFKRALDSLDEAIRVLEAKRSDCEPTTIDEKEVRVELADTHGMKGGISRRMGEDDAALAAYTTGARIEKNGNLSTTYNRSNVITLSITAKGLAPTDQAIRMLLANVIEELERETKGPRRDEWWAWSDLAQFYLLNGEPDKARACYTNALSKTGATVSEIKRHVAILADLAGKIAESAPTIAANIRAAIAELSR
jgi:tetratricopeptide (TPR) repeat protein